MKNLHEYILSRPPHVGTFPAKGMRRHLPWSHGLHGSLLYDRELSLAECRKYELQPILKKSKYLGQEVLADLDWDEMLPAEVSFVGATEVQLRFPEHGHTERLKPLDFLHAIDCGKIRFLDVKIHA